ncbi:MAG: glycosyltransferase family 4 protein, partial [Desulfobacterales bacterium]
MKNKNQNNNLICLSIFYKHKKGGFNKRLYQLYLALAKRDHTIHYAAVEEFPIEHPNIVKHLLRVPFKKRENIIFWLLFTLWSPFYCLWIAKKYRVNRIIIFSSFYAFVCSLAVISLRIKMVTFLRADVLLESHYEKKSLFKIFLNNVFDRIGLRWSCLVIANSKSLGRKISQRAPKANLAILPNNIEYECSISQQRKDAIHRHYGFSDEHFIIATAAPLNRVKNIGFLIEAFSQLDSSLARLLVIGDDLKDTGERKRLEKFSIESGVAVKTVFTGWLDNPCESIASADLFVLPSFQEGSPNALLEALSCNVACMGSRIPEIAEILGDDELLFCLSSPRELTQKIQRSISDPSYADKLRHLSIKRKQEYRFDWDKRAVEL